MGIIDYIRENKNTLLQKAVDINTAVISGIAGAVTLGASPVKSLGLLKSAGSFIVKNPKTAGALVLGTPIVAGAVMREPTIIADVPKVAKQSASSLTNIGGNIATAIKNPTAENFSNIIKENPIATSVLTAGTLAAVGGIGAAASIGNTLATKENTQVLKDSPIGNNSVVSAGSPTTESQPVFAEETPTATKEKPINIKITNKPSNNIAIAIANTKSKHIKR